MVAVKSNNPTPVAIRNLIIDSPCGLSTPRMSGLASRLVGGGPPFFAPPDCAHARGAGRAFPDPARCAGQSAHGSPAPSRGAPAIEYASNVGGRSAGGGWDGHCG